MKSGSRVRWIVALSGVVVLILVQLALLVQIGSLGMLHLAQPHEEGSVEAEPTSPEAGPEVAPAALGVERLQCFGCHSIERYRNGEDFAHALHEDVGHCHVCHAFEGHLEVRIRQETCEQCH